MSESSAHGREKHNGPASAVTEDPTVKEGGQRRSGAKEPLRELTSTSLKLETILADLLIPIVVGGRRSDERTGRERERI